MGDLCQPGDAHPGQESDLVCNDLPGVHRLIPAADKFKGHIRWSHLVQVARRGKVGPYALDGSWNDLFAVKNVNHEETSSFTALTLPASPLGAGSQFQYDDRSTITAPVGQHQSDFQSKVRCVVDGFSIEDLGTGVKARSWGTCLRVAGLLIIISLNIEPYLFVSPLMRKEIPKCTRKVSNCSTRQSPTS